MNSIENYNEKTLDDIKHISEWGTECWYSRELMELLNYSNWNSFEKVIKKAMTSCKMSGQDIEDHFTEVNIYSKDYRLSRFACYLIVENADSRKEKVALTKSYIVIQTMRQERKEKNKVLEMFIHSQTEAKIKRENIKTDININKAYCDTKKVVKETLATLDNIEINN